LFLSSFSLVQKYHFRVAHNNEKFINKFDYINAEMGLGDFFKGIFNREEEIPEPMRPCDRCGFEFPEALMVTDGSKVFCSPCHGKRKQDIADADLKRRQALANMKIKYYCYECKFHFARKQDFPINMCPNCGSSKFVPEDRLMQ